MDASRSARQFLIASETGSFSAAAEQLNQSGITGMISSSEEKLIFLVYPQ